MATCVWRFLHLREQLTWDDDKQTSIPPWPVMHVVRAVDFACVPYSDTVWMVFSIILDEYRKRKKTNVDNRRKDKLTVSCHQIHQTLAKDVIGVLFDAL